MTNFAAKTNMRQIIKKILVKILLWINKQSTLKKKLLTIVEFLEDTPATSKLTKKIYDRLRAMKSTPQSDQYFKFIPTSYGLENYSSSDSLTTSDLLYFSSTVSKVYQNLKNEIVNEHRS